MQFPSPGNLVDDVSPLQYLQEFISSCEALDLVPEDETQNSVHVSGDTLAAKREKKVSLRWLLVRVYFRDMVIIIGCFLCMIVNPY